MFSVSQSFLYVKVYDQRSTANVGKSGLSWLNVINSWTLIYTKEWPEIKLLATARWTTFVLFKAQIYGSLWSRSKVAEVSAIGWSLPTMVPKMKILCSTNHSSWHSARMYVRQNPEILYPHHRRLQIGMRLLYPLVPTSTRCCVRQHHSNWRQLHDWWVTG